MNCWQCGSPLPADVGFCRACGAILRGKGSPVPPAPGAAPAAAVDPAGPQGSPSPQLGVAPRPSLGASAGVSPAPHVPWNPGPLGAIVPPPATAPGSSLHGGDLVALAGSVLAASSLFMNWYVINVSSAGLRYLNRALQALLAGAGYTGSAVALPTNSYAVPISALDHLAGGWRWAILVVAAVCAVESLLAVVSFLSSASKPSWPHAPVALALTLLDLVLLVAAYFDVPPTGMPAQFASVGHAFGAYLGVAGGLAAAIGAGAAYLRAGTGNRS